MVGEFSGEIGVLHKCLKNSNSRADEWALKLVVKTLYGDSSVRCLELAELWECESRFGEAVLERLEFLESAG